MRHAPLTAPDLHAAYAVGVSRVVGLLGIAARG